MPVMGVGTRYMGRINQPLTNEAARKLMALDVQDKEILTYEKLDEWYTAWGGQCYVSFSGGKDSTVLRIWLRGTCRVSGHRPGS